MSRRWTASLLLAVLPLTGACNTVGPRAIRQGRFDYAQAIVDTRNEQMLTNLVRLRYRDSPFFLDVSSLSTQYVLGGAASAGVNLGGGDTTGNVGGLVTYEERPTVTYLPLKGADFVDRLLSPLPMEAILLLTMSGWRVERVMRCCVQRINDVWNAPTASGPTPEMAPDYEEFLELSRRMERLRQARVTEMRFQRSDDEESVNGYLLTLYFHRRPGAEEDTAAVKEILGLAPDLDEFRLTRNPTHRTPGEIGLIPRSLMGAMSYLSQSVEPPRRDVDAGRVTVTRHPDGSEFDWRELTGGLLAIRSSLETPQNAFVKTRYRDAWFYIDDSDLSSKSTFNLLEQLFQLQADKGNAVTPLLTLPVGN
jgi:hypothetical protein